MTGSLSEMQDATLIADMMRKEISKVFFGQNKIINNAIIAFIAGGHLLIEGTPGLGKTLLAKALAKTFQGSFARIQFTTDLSPAEIKGHMMFDQQTQRFVIRKGPLFNQLILADEINRAPARTTAVLLEVLQEQQITLEGKTFTLTQPFMMIATLDSQDTDGTYPLSEALLDRFLFKLTIDYPNEEDETYIVKQISQQHANNALDVSAVTSFLSAQQIINMQIAATHILVDQRLYEYAVKIARKTRTWPGVLNGTGSRGAIAIIRAARAHALLFGKSYVTPDDIKAVVNLCLAHRITLAPEIVIEGQSHNEILSAIVSSVSAPRI